MNFATGQMTPPLRRPAAAEYHPMTPEAGGKLAARGRPTLLVEVRPQGTKWSGTQASDSSSSRLSMLLCCRWWTSWWTFSNSLTRFFLLSSRFSSKCPRLCLRTTSRSALRSESRKWWNSWWKCRQSLLWWSRPFTFQFLVVLGVFIFEVSSQNRDQQLVAMEVFKVFAQDRVQQRHPQFLALRLLR